MRRRTLILRRARGFSAPPPLLIAAAVSAAGKETYRCGMRVMLLALLVLSGCYAEGVALDGASYVLGHTAGDYRRFVTMKACEAASRRTHPENVFVCRKKLLGFELEERLYQGGERVF